MFEHIDLSEYILFVETMESMVPNTASSACTIEQPQAKRVCKPQTKSVCKENNVNTTTNDFRYERGALEAALFSARATKDIEMRKHFGLFEERPITPKKLVEAIQTGKFTYVDEKTADDEGTWDSWMNPARGIKFGDPDRKEDKRGFKKATEAATKVFNAVLTDIAVLDPEKGLKAVREFESKTFH